MQMLKPNILYVDDEHYNLTAFVAAFRRYYNIFTSTSVREAIEILKHQTVDLIITDQRMPEMTGVQFLEALLTEYPEPVRMILTGFTDVDAIKRAINNGCVLRYITKPWNENELKQIIDMGIKIHELEQNQRLLIKKLESGLDQKKKTIELFEKYLQPDILEQVLNLGPEQLFASRGEHRIISTLFSDIRRFTRFSETLSSKEVVSYLNRYFAMMINCVIKNHGSVYKLLGDGLMATFGAPTSSIYNQRNAVYCALDMMEELKVFNNTVGKEFSHETAIGIGITTGSSIVGHIMSEHNLSYVALGASVNRSIELEDLTREIPNAVLIDESTYSEVKNDVTAEALKNPEIEAKYGKVYKVIGKND